MKIVSGFVGAIFVVEEFQRHGGVICVENAILAVKMMTRALIQYAFYVLVVDVADLNQVLDIINKHIVSGSINLQIVNKFTDRQYIFFNNYKNCKTPPFALHKRPPF